MLHFIRKHQRVLRIVLATLSFTLVFIVPLAVLFFVGLYWTAFLAAVPAAFLGLFIAGRIDTKLLEKSRIEVPVAVPISELQQYLCMHDLAHSAPLGTYLKISDIWNHYSKSLIYFPRKTNIDWVIEEIHLGTSFKLEASKLLRHSSWSASEILLGSVNTEWLGRSSIVFNQSLNLECGSIVVSKEIELDLEFLHRPDPKWHCHYVPSRSREVALERLWKVFEPYGQIVRYDLPNLRYVVINCREDATQKNTFDRLARPSTEFEDDYFRERRVPVVRSNDPIRPRLAVAGIS